MTHLLESADKKGMSLAFCISANLMPISNRAISTVRQTQEDSFKRFLDVLGLHAEKIFPIKGNATNLGCLYLLVNYGSGRPKNKINRCK